jgi:spermidine synthase
MSQAALRRDDRPIPRAILLVFRVSGFSALLYQIVWQRALFELYGLNVESVTVVVTTFMLGLGLGSLAGGALSTDPRRPLMLVFAVVELGIGLFGWFSLSLFRAVGAWTLGLSPLGTGLSTFLLMLVPTMLMGGTLPLLVAHLVRGSGNVGRSVAVLYYVNTLGSALGAFAAAFWLLAALGQTNTTRLAAALNLVVSFVVLRHHRRERSPA